MSALGKVVLGGLVLGGIGYGIYRATRRSAGPLVGDVNGDGEVNMGDIITVQRIIMGLPGTDDIPYSDEVRARADVNGDGEINEEDIEEIQRIMLGL